MELRSLADRYPRLRRASVLILVAGGLVAYTAVKPYLPHDHPVAYRLDPDPATLTDLEVTWTHVGSSEEPLLGTTYHFAAGTAPSEIRATVRGPDGDYVVDVDATAGGQHHRLRSRLALSEGVCLVRVPLAQSSELPPSSPQSSVH